jgi:hypothetical protein
MFCAAVIFRPFDLYSDIAVIFATCIVVTHAARKTWGTNTPLFLFRPPVQRISLCWLPVVSYLVTIALPLTLLV